MKLSIRWKILLFVVIPIVAIYTVIMAINIFTMRQWALTNVEERMTELADNYAHNFDSHLREVAQVAKMTAAYVERNPDHSSEAIYSLLQSNLEYNPLVYGSAVAFEPFKYEPSRRLFVRYVFRDGKSLQRADPSETGYDYTDLKQEYWHLPRDTGGAVWTDPYFDEGAGNILMSTYSVPFFSNHEFLGIATVDIPLKPLRELTETAIPVGIKVSIITKSGKVVYSPHPGRINKSITEIWQGLEGKDALALAWEIASGKTGFTKLTHWESDDNEWVFYSPIDSSGWGFAASVSASKVLQPVQRQFYRGIGFFLISLGVIVIVLWFFSRKISQPILRLNEVVEEISNGNFTVKAVVESEDEIGALATAFNQMTEKVAEREAKILQSEQRLKALLSNLPQKIFKKDIDSVYLDCNEKFAVDLQITPEQIVGKTDYDFFPKELADQYRREDKEIIESGQIKTVEEEYILKGGEKGIIQTVRTPIWNDQGEVTGLLGIFMDTTERKKAEEELLKWGHIFEHAQWGIALGSADGKNFQLMNPAYATMHGFAVDELLGKNISDMFAPAFRDQLPDIIKKCHEMGHYTFEGDHLHKDGSIFPVYHDVTTVRKENGKVLYRIVGILDITDRKKGEEEKANLESQLRQAHKMEAIGTLAGGIAHDFNNILAAILGYTEMISDEVPEFSPVQRDVQEVMKAGMRAKELVKHILAFSRKSEQERVPVAIHSIVEEALELLRASIPTTIEIRLNISHKCGAVLADPTQIHQVIMNLCTNAAQAMDDTGGVLEVAFDPAEFSDKELQSEPALRPGQYVKLTIRDNGPGIDPGNIDRIFDPYFTTKEVGKGSGMGLAVVHGIIQSHDGIILVDSEPGVSTMFSVYLPRIKKRLQKEVENIDILPTGSERILVVDDEVSVVEMMKRRLERFGYQVTAETDSQAALDLFRSQPDKFDLVITDQTMPKMTGEQLVGALKKINADIPIIVCTGYSAKIDAKKAGLLGISAFIMKPISKKDIANVIRQVLDK